MRFVHKTDITKSTKSFVELCARRNSCDMKSFDECYLNDVAKANGTNSHTKDRRIVCFNNCDSKTQFLSPLYLVNIRFLSC